MTSDNPHVPPSIEEQFAIQHLSQELAEVCSGQPLTVAVSAIQSVVMSVFCHLDPAARGEMREDFTVLLQLMEHVGDATGEEARQRAKATPTAMVFDSPGEPVAPPKQQVVARRFDELNPEEQQSALDALGSMNREIDDAMVEVGEVLLPRGGPVSVMVMVQMLAVVAGADTEARSAIVGRLHALDRVIQKMPPHAVTDPEELMQLLESDNIANGFPVRPAGTALN